MIEYNLARKLPPSESTLPVQADQKLTKPPVIRKLKKRAQSMVSKRQMALSMLFVAYVLIACVGLVSMRLTIAEQNKQMLEQEKILDELSMEHTRLNLEVEKISSLKSLEIIAREELGMVKEDKSQINYVWIEKNNKIELADNGTAWYEPMVQLFQKAKTYFVG